MTHAEQIRGLVERWAEAVHIGDLHTVLADHADVSAGDEHHSFGDLSGESG